ncbi:MAG: hypothetical protein A2561_02470 [Candidatus Staskawiczbacteria bacterium RIFOXYD1_FULL_32_13]|uniref:Polysaccharide biosynthesis protein CapD-like domain-containing protein n=1 Tax=Candidatus Staskawiczbacteria bacterium RIFOXYD1_FULL_32_13 TaxID=1802234 RepID=A0A1G2JQ55_9BACT|nr:MAG: Polysaccharide biosynthesis protein CapD [Parcubacteria group bacterium GW2011_GWC2_32_10]OGZ77741.1 MAG: hypothetical protein A2256_02565 [Candidatus Staskawiczbacteria bacterium RIFOXYA2_FULL_32_7]OGZ87081.1 MAG: hypothetical protein A2463_03530 [Candidatus Staskawiczbacteria bacterium RIFOXYC2_FULL_32_10]OGZ89274.1 MAG: hypothetical protein A2561_02470 [Candidatus Staskawiczbacteria bacterium RIFOXYD1_FULL_32_13]
MFPLTKKTAFKRKLFFLISDVVLISLAVWFAFLMRFDSHIPLQLLEYLPFLILLEVVITLPVFYFLRLYSFSWSYVSASEAVSLFFGTIISFFISILAIYILKLFFEFESFPRSTILISYFLIFIFSGCLRFAKRVYLHNRKISKDTEKEKTLIVGAGDAGEQILRGILSSKNGQYNPIGFVDDSPIKKGVNIHGLKVLGKIDDIVKIAESQGVRNLIIALPSAGSQTIRKAIELGKKAKIRKIKIIPPISEMVTGQVLLKNLKEVGVEDLLGRNKVEIDTRKIENFVKGKVVLITGAAGSIGSELARQVIKFKPKQLLLLDQDETGIFNISKEILENLGEIKLIPLIADITDRLRIDEIFSKYQPKIIFHAAAYKHVPLMEENVREAVKNNIFGTRNIAELSVQNGVEKFVMISTDKAINPTSVMGATKRVCEIICQSINKLDKTKFMSVRFGNVLNSRGSVIPIFREQIKKGGPIEVTDPNMKRYFMLTSEACLLVMQAGAMGNGGEVFVLNMGEPVKILDLAKDMIKLSGFEPDKDIAIIFTGIRPGEKLFEEMLTMQEGLSVTQSKEIFMAKLSEMDFTNFSEKLLELENLTEDEKIKSMLRNILPNYN